jgi:acetate kinase
MHILVINSGSSSIKFAVYSAEAADPKALFEGEVTGIGTGKARLKFEDASGRDLTDGHRDVPATDSRVAMGQVVETLRRAQIPAVQAVGHRVVHPGSKLTEHVQITDEVMRDLKAAEDFAPLHDPPAIAIIEEGMRLFPDAKHYACFDTIFHETMSKEAATYALPKHFRDVGVKRYGFHGLSCESVVRQMRTAGIRLPQRMVIAHLGSGCSVTALLAGRSTDTSMGLTPTGGVVMGTRPGDLDPGVVLYLSRKMKGDRKEADAGLERALNYESGVSGLAELPNDMKATREAAAKGDESARLAIAVFTRSVRKAIGAYCWLMGGLDAIVFAGGIGEHDVRTRSEVLEGLEGVGVRLDSTLNASENLAKDERLRAIHASDSKTRVFIVPAREDLMIAVHVKRMNG